jgi:hypothetical protein
MEIQEFSSHKRTINMNKPKQTINVGSITVAIDLTLKVSPDYKALEKLVSGTSPYEYER